MPLRTLTTSCLFCATDSCITVSKILLWQVVPQLDDVLYGCEYYWVAAQAEYSTDVMFKTAEGLRELYPRPLSHSTLCFGAKEVMNFLGRKLVGNFRRRCARGRSSMRAKTLSIFVCSIPRALSLRASHSWPLR